MAYMITTTGGNTILVDADCGRPDVNFIAFYKRGEPVIQKRFERRGIWPFRYNESVEQEIVPESWVVSIRTSTIAQMRPVEADEFAELTAANSKPTT